MLLRPLKHLFRFSKGELETLQVPVLWMLKCFYLLEHGWLGQARVIYGCIWAEFACFIFRWMCVHEPDHWRSFVPSPGCGSFSHFCQEGPVFCLPPPSAGPSSFVVGDIGTEDNTGFRGLCHPNLIVIFLIPAPSITLGA